MGWKSLGELLAPGVEQEGDIARSARFLARAAALGARLR